MADGKPFSLKDLLKYSIKCSNGINDADGAKGLDPERRQFLENALKAMTVDVLEELTKAIDILDTDTSNDEAKRNALNTIRDYIDNMDFANSFVKLGGCQILLKCWNNNHTEIRVSILQIVAEMSQNNPFCQQYFLENGTVKLLMPCLSDTNEDIVTNALYALSAIVRNFTPGITELIKLGGLSLILKTLDLNISRVFNKACFLIASLCSNFPEVCDEFINLNAFQLLARYVEVVNDFDVKTESLLNAMSQLTKSKYFNMSKLCDEDLKNNLQIILDTNQTLPQCEEIVLYAKQILEKI